MTVETLALNDYQRRVLLVPEEYDLALVGSRGVGKSWAIAHLIVRHCAQYGAQARAVYVRRSFPGLQDFSAILREVLPLAFDGASYNSQAHLWSLPNGSTVELGILESPADYLRWQGRSATFIAIDELGDYPDLALAERLRSNLRGPAGMPLRLVVAANPGGLAHDEIARRFVLTREPWEPYLDKRSGREFVTCSGTFRGNVFIDTQRYEKQLVASCAGDPELLKAWLDGRWDVARGSFFGSVLEPERVALSAELWTPGGAYLDSTVRRPISPKGGYVNIADAPGSERALDLYLSYDHGTGAPAVCYVCGESRGFIGPDGRAYPRGSILALDELAFHDPESLSKGLGLTVPEIAGRIRDMAKAWRMQPAGVADDAIWQNIGGAGGPIAIQFRDAGVRFRQAKKGDRASGWSRLRTMFQAAGSTDLPGYYVSRRCGYFWATAPTAPRDPRRPEDLATNCNDHGLDAIRYSLGFQRGASGIVFGNFM